MPPQPLPNPTITLPPPVEDVASPTLWERQNIVTLSVTETPTITAKPQPAKFPFAVAIPALAGGMAIAVIVALTYLYCVRRKKRQRRERYEARQRRAKRRAKEAALRRANSAKRHQAMSSRSNSSTNLVTPMSEKTDHIPPVPALPKEAYHSPASSSSSSSIDEKDTSPSPSPPRHHDNYSTQPTIDSTTQPSSTSPTKPITPPKSSSRSAARMAAADRAAASAFGDPNTRHQPRKPSPLAGDKNPKKWSRASLSATFRASFRRDREHSTEMKSPSPFREDDMDDAQSFEYDAYDERPSSPGSDYGRGPSGDWSAGQNRDRKTSGEWRVSSGSAAYDGTVERQSGNGRNRYSGDPYLSVPGPNGGASDARGKSGMYGSDPYSAYHGEEELRDEDFDDEEEDTGEPQPAPVTNKWRLGMGKWL
ncbi:hypothetical protein BD324DRAFT_647861 [Kockovaella imperatae]|uniref:Uncharacterized protein n=1 Tax=Kockovaella imperatae TaxID=4999 RepID=A0A1Y1USF9_9TREE|nr:hypothetical protein BD324DRAFT_647861 [Kockovaella imperatae]ORX40958.1 hypothetical protein BD324DRAFT_647861 [Kockovaella imperatae]